MPFSALDTAYLEDFLDANEAMDVFGDRNDLDLRPPPGAPGVKSEPPQPERTHIQMSARQFTNMIS